MTLPGSGRLTRCERGGLFLVGLLVIAFGALTEMRSCFSHTRMTDFGVYLRAGWAVRSGADLYQVTDNNGWHYVYPPAFAVLISPLADAPAGQSRDGLVSYELSVALWTLFNFFLVGRIAHVLASLILPDEETRSRRWWYARTVPVYVAIGGIGFTISHGQVNLLLVAMLVEMLRTSLTGKRLESGLWLAAAITLKVIPAYLLLYPLMRRDARSLAGTALGLILGFGVIPLAGLGEQRTIEAYRSFADRVLLPGATGAENPSLGKELLDVGATDSQSFLSVIHNNLYPDRKTQPKNASTETRFAHAGIAAALTLIVLFVVWRRGLPSTADELIFLGLLTLIMLHATPVSHMHYYALGYPLAAGLWLKGMAANQSQVSPGWRVNLPLILWAVGTGLPLFPGPFFDVIRHRGLGLASSLMLFSVGVVELGRVRRNVAIPIEQPREERLAA